ncbi:MAG: ATP-binding cassette domain-containing protein [Mycoplasmataceae bacterium]|jgi:energy-coupling factor transport system ATP-binding protein|nr:ATP-binding cassette domain-containing protein [Mycoplasmataceae bacterium]
MSNKQITIPQSPYAITVDHLRIVFDERTSDETLVLDNFSYKFEKNKIYFIIGNSGSGKTTLVSHFNGLIKSKHGDLVIGGLPILGKKRKIKNFKKLRKTVGMVFQFPEYQLFKDTVEKDIIFGPVNLGVKKDEAKLKARTYLKQVGLDESFLQRSPFGLSGGQKRRVAIAGILAIEPDILVFDEPTAGLDPAGEREMLETILDLKNKGKTVFVITHVMDQVLALGDEVVVLGNKKVIASGTPYQIFTNEKLITESELDLPRVIKIIDGLVKRDVKFKSLLDQQPRNVNELAVAINRMISHKEA